MKRSYTVQELAERWQVHRATIYRMMQRGEIASFKVGATRRIRAEEVESYEQKLSHDVAPRRPVSQ
jgi:excisionase family DNA binding protein